ncbi:MAG: type IV secretory system conjugative DNA transfer family protein [Candidatus Portnoybacteria bacterium]|nr:type IV secretory system conjugative DNA transfer family protein [Candidatus Portnoybacteria bacterium]
MNLNQIFLLATLLLALAIIVVGSLLFIRQLKNKGRLTRALNMSLFLITLPKKKVKKEEGEAPKSEKEIISVMEQLYASLSNIRETKDVFIYGQPHLVLEIATPQIGEEIAFYLALPRGYEDVIEKQIHGFYPEASIAKTEDYNIFNPQGGAAGSYLKLAKSHVLPFKTYQNLEKDPLNEITNTLSKLEEKGEGAAIQITIRPTLSKQWTALGLKIAKEMQQGKNYEVAKIRAERGWFRRNLGYVFEVIKGPPRQKTEPGQSSEAEGKPALTPLQEEVIKSLEGKAGKVGFDVNLRLLVSAGTQPRAEQILSHLEAAFVQFNAPNLNQLKSFRLKKGRALKKLIYNFSFRFFNQRQRMLLNTEELTSLFHFPTTTIETPKVKFLKAEPAAPPANMPKEGAILGKNLYRGMEAVIRLQKDDRRRHLYVIGQTGTGKSVFLRNMIIQDIKNGHGIGLLDPHGDLVEGVLGLIPKERAEDVIILDPADLERPLGLNMLDYDAKYPEQKTFAVNELMSIFDKLYDLKATGGPMFEQYTRNALLLLMDDPTEKFTLMEVPKVMADADFRKNLLVKCQNMVVKDFWEKEAEKAGGEAALQNVVPYITSKFNVFIANDYMRPIIGQSETSLNFRQIMDEQKILLVNLSKGRLGDANSSLLGLIVTGKLLMAAFSRIDMPEEERKDFYLYMDEFQNFATDSIATILSEARKYRLCLTMAHQFIGQLTEEIQKAVFGNVGSMVGFRVGAEDAEFLVKQFEPVFDTNSLINIDNFNAHIKLMINNETSKPFNLLTYPPEKGSPKVTQAIKELARLKYGRDKAVVDKEIAGRWQSAVPVEATAPPSPDMEVK